MDFLLVQTPEGQGYRHELRGEIVRVGRASSNDLILHDRFVSRLHAEIQHRPEGYYLFDVGEKTGTFVNDLPIREPFLLRSGDRIQVGKTTLVFNGSLPTPVEFSDRPPLGKPKMTFRPVGNFPTISVMDLLRNMEPATSSLPTPGISGEGEEQLSTVPLLVDKSLRSLSPSALEIILEADRELVFHGPIQDILNKILDLARRAVPFERGLLMRLRNGELVPEAVRVPREESGKPISISRTITQRVLDQQESILTSDALIDERFRGGKSVQSQHLRSVMCVPLWNQREVIGLIYVDNPQRPSQFAEEDLIVLTHLATVAAVKIEHQKLFDQAVAARSMEMDLQKAAEIQRHLLPGEAPDIPGYLLFGYSLPCQAVGGDSYDYLELHGNRFGIALGDVAGKGLPAAMLMCTFQASLRALSDQELLPDETLVRLNQLLCPQIPMNRYVTFFYGVLDPVRHSLTYANAGHDPPFLIRDGIVAETLSYTGGPVGSFEEIPYQFRTIILQPGDLLLCYSDGATDGRNPAGEFFGKDRLAEIACKDKKASPIEIVQRIEEEIEKHHAGAPQTDDITLVALKRNG